MEGDGTPRSVRSFSRPDEGATTVDGKKQDEIPPQVFTRGPERELEEELRRNPDDPDARADVGSDESMDASDPSSATQPGCPDDEPAPSSGFPE